MENKVTILGARGSVPVSGKGFQHHGGSTTCILIELGGETILVDAGTGLLNLPEEVLALPRIPLLLTHPHLDHLLGLPMCPYLFRREAVLELYAAKLEGRSAKEQVNAIFSPPLWPVGAEMLPGKLLSRDMPKSMALGGIRVDTMPGVHPGGVTILRVCGGGRSIIIVTDCTLTDELLPPLTDFARGCDLLLCDGQYSDAEWEQRSGFGHSTWRAAAFFARAAGAGEARVVHHDPGHTDAVLDKAAPELLSIHGHCGFAYQGEVICL